MATSRRLIVGCFVVSLVVFFVLSSTAKDYVPTASSAADLRKWLGGIGGSGYDEAPSPAASPADDDAAGRKTWA